jgi:hypothetical protein
VAAAAAGLLLGFGWWCGLLGLCGFEGWHRDIPPTPVSFRAKSSKERG